jgi:hypothetical protein
MLMRSGRRRATNPGVTCSGRSLLGEIELTLRRRDALHPVEPTVAVQGPADRLLARPVRQLDQRF